MEPNNARSLAMPKGKLNMEEFESKEDKRAAFLNHNQSVALPKGKLDLDGNNDPEQEKILKR